VIDDHPAKSASSDMSTRANIISGVVFQKGQIRRYEKYDRGGWLNARWERLHIFPYVREGHLDVKENMERTFFDGGGKGLL
jgi:hypothetical protein